MIAIYTITSGLHDEQSVSRLSDTFLKGIFPEGGFLYKGADFSDFGTHTLDLIYVRTGGAEGIFKGLLPEMRARGIGRFYLLTSGKSNSLAASLEILSYLRQHELPGEIIHGTDDFVAQRLKDLAQVFKTKKRLDGFRIARVGKPSDWLISSDVDADESKQGSDWKGVKIISPNEMTERVDGFDYLIVAHLTKYMEIHDAAVRNGVNMEQIILPGQLVNELE